MSRCMITNTWMLSSKFIVDMGDNHVQLKKP